MALNEILTPKHPVWHHFARGLNYALGRCGGCSGDFTLSEILLTHPRFEAMRFFDAAGTLRYFKSRKAHCDCEVLAKVALDLDSSHDSLNWDSSRDSTD